MIIVYFDHPLHGDQIMKCSSIRKQGDTLLLVNDFGVAFQGVKIEWLDRIVVK